jgi:hypothetical protein
MRIIHPHYQGASTSIEQQIRANGYVVVRNLLRQHEIGKLRASLLKHFERQWQCEGLGKHQPSAADTIPEISWIFEHPRIVDTFRTLFGGQQPIFTTNCDAHMNMLSWWHKDTSESRGGCFPGDYFARDSCQVYRAGIYLQDQPKHGLTVRRGSHRHKDITKGESIHLETNAGDVVFFDIRLTHAGQFADQFENGLLRLGRRLRMQEGAMALKNRYQKLLGKPEKLSVFFTYGAPGPDTEAFLEFERKNKRGRLACGGANQANAYTPAVK